jgi:hypothetical protein
MLPSTVGPVFRFPSDFGGGCGFAIFFLYIIINIYVILLLMSEIK